MSEKNIRLKPSRKAWFWWYVLGILLIPLLGAGIYLLYRLNRTYHSINYIITDREITASDSKITERTDIANIRDVKLRQRRTDRQFDIADLILVTPEKEVVLQGMENPKALSEMILKAAEAERQRLKTAQKKQSRPDPPKPETDKLDYLTGLWQQGLITNEEFEQEKKHFE